MYRYFMTQRPPCPGAQPRRGLVNISELDPNSNTPGIGRVYAVLEYDRELTEEEVRSYELTPIYSSARHHEYKGYRIDWDESTHSYSVSNPRGLTIAYVDTVPEAIKGIDVL